jgi:hypothetical protein
MPMTAPATTASAALETEEGFSLEVGTDIETALKPLIKVRDVTSEH